MGGKRVAAHTCRSGQPASPASSWRGPWARRSTRAGRVQVEPDLSVPGAPDVFVIGDLAAVSEKGKEIPGVAPAAMQGGTHAAKMIARRVAGKPTEPFHYVDKGSLATIGRAAAVAQIGDIHLHGFIAWMAWLLIHILFLIGFRNRVLVLLEWAWAYVAFDRGARVITAPWKARAAAAVKV